MAKQGGKAIMKSKQGFIASRKKSFFLLAMNCILLSAQIKTDSILPHKLKFTDNHFGPFHQIIQDTAKRTLSTFGHYFSVGAGLTKNFGIKEVDELISYSLVYKSHIFSATFGYNKVVPERLFVDSWYTGHNINFLIGESLRFKHLMLSLCTGISFSKLEIFNPAINKFYAYYLENGKLAIPVELKIFALARNGIGIGLHISENIMPQLKYSTLYTGFTIVAGYWNKPRAKK